MTELDPNRITPEPDTQGTRSEGDRPGDDTNTPADDSVPPPVDDPVDTETVSDEEAAGPPPVDDVA